MLIDSEKPVRFFLCNRKVFVSVVASKFSEELYCTVLDRNWQYNKSGILCSVMPNQPSCFPTLPAGISRSFVSPLCDAMVPHSLLFPSLLGFCPGCLGSHHSSWCIHITYTHTHTNVQASKGNEITLLLIISFGYFHLVWR